MMHMKKNKILAPFFLLFVLVFIATSPLAVDTAMAQGDISPIITGDPLCDSPSPTMTPAQKSICDRKLDDAITAAGSGGNIVTAVKDLGKSITGGVKSLFSITGSMFLYIINALLYGVLWIVAQLLNWVTVLLSNILNYKDIVNSPFVANGWSAVVQFANLFFIVFLLVIAFATILDIGEYSYESLLWRLLLAAIMINFSKVICGFFIDMSNIVTLDLVNRAGGKDVGEMVPGMAKMGKVFDASKAADDSWLANTENDFSTQLQVFLTLVLNICFFVGMIFITLAMCVMFIIRIIALMVLVILFPIVWVLWILPKTRNYWNEWWSSFIKWNLFGPVCMFFLTLASQSAVKITQSVGGGSSPATLSALKAGDTTTGLTSSISYDFFLGYAVTFGFLAASLITAQKMGIAGAGAAMALAKKGKAYAGKQASYAAARAPGVGRVRAELDARAERRQQILATQQGLYKENIARRQSGREQVKDVRGEAATRTDFERSTLGMTDTEKIKQAHTLQEAARADKEAGLGTTTVSAAQGRRRAGAAAYLAETQRRAPGRVDAALKEEGVVQEEALRESKIRELRAQEGMTDEVMALEMKKYDLEKKHIVELAKMTEAERKVQQPRMAEEVKHMGDDIKRIKQRDEYEKSLNKNSKIDEGDVKALLAHFDTETKNEKRLREMTLEEEVIRRPRIELAQGKEKARLEKIAEIKYDGRNQGLEGKAFADFVAAEKIKRGVTEDTQEKFVKQLKDLMEGATETPKKGTAGGDTTPPPAAPAAPAAPSSGPTTTS
jgi:hypothetical protein